MNNAHRILAIKSILAFILWLGAYLSTAPLAHWLTYTLFALPEDSALGHSAEFFLYDAPKILLLLVFMVYVIGWLRAGLSTDQVRDYLQGKKRSLGYALGATFGAITPFCSCSSIPLFLGFTTARIPVGITMAFLITSPVINEVAVVLLWGLLGWKFTVVYVGVGLLAGILRGILMDTFHAERWLQPYLLEEIARPQLRMLSMAGGRFRISPMQRHDFAWREVRNIFQRVWKWVILGVSIGAFLHGFIPQDWFVEHFGAGHWWNVPLASALGIPLYTNVTGIIPVMESLLLKGLPLGTTLAFCMSAVAASLPEIIMLKQMMRWPLLATFLGYLFTVFTISGWMFNALFPSVI